MPSDEYDDYPDPMHDGPDAEPPWDNERDPPDPPECSKCKTNEHLELVWQDSEYWYWACQECEDEISQDKPPMLEPPDPYDDDYLIDGVGFADPGGRSALRAATKDNPRDQPCPTCGRENVLTRIDRQQHYVCDRCADRAEGRPGGDY